MHSWRHTLDNASHSLMRPIVWIFQLQHYLTPLGLGAPRDRPHNLPTFVIGQTDPTFHRVAPFGLGSRHR